MNKKPVCVCVTICMCVVVAAFYLFWHAYHAVSLKPVQIFFSKLFCQKVKSIKEIWKTQN